MNFLLPVGIIDCWLVCDGIRSWCTVGVQGGAGSAARGSFAEARRPRVCAHLSARRTCLRRRLFINQTALRTQNKTIHLNEPRLLYIFIPFFS